jgi:hypothetical protein
MKRQSILYFIIAVVFLITGIMISCKKDKQKITINGSVYSPNQQSYVSNAHVTISASMVTSGFYNSNYTTIASTTTDGSGAFTFEFDKLKSAGYRIFIWKDNYFDNTIDIPDADVIAGTPYVPAYNIYPVAYLKLHVRNYPAYDSLDYIAYYYSEGALSCYQCCSNSVLKGYGETYDTIAKCKTYGGQNVTINWHVKKGPWDGTLSDTIYCTPFDTTTYEIIY